MGPLTPAEQAELSQLEAEDAQASASPAKGVLSPAEEEELASLEASHGNTAPRSTDSQLDSAVKGAQNTVSMGYAPQIAGATSAVTDKVLQGLGSLGIGPMKNMPAGAPQPSMRDSYLSGRDGRIADDKASSEANPWSHGAGSVGGAVLTAPLMAGKAVAGAGALGRIGQAAKTGAIMGGAYNPGDTAGEMDPLQLGDRAKNAAMGGAVGGLVSGATEGLRSGVDAAKGAMRKVVRMEPNQAQSYVNNPSKVQGMADQLESQSPETLIQKGNKAKQAATTTLEGLLGAGKTQTEALNSRLADKSILLRPSDWQGLHPELDAHIASTANPYGQIAQEVSVPASLVQKAKQAAQAEAKYSPSHVFDPIGKARAEDMGAKATQLRQMLEEAGGPEVASLNKQMQQNALLSKDVRGMLRNPVAAFKTGSEDKLLKMALADKAAGQVKGGLYDYAGDRGAAAALAKGDVGSGVSGVPIRWLAKQGLKTAYGAGSVVDKLDKAAYGSRAASPSLVQLLQELGRKK